ncbi:hypothetical protein CkaCkLH20_06185 [Colletotrichum karsti]|uniref:Uncharacterized protein n=1 Tax=Colletotrichum karsti TaxID=1095194 RepID=A0A9P6LL64_9PEZI|nr:uncharacterized protein CkaCkLH20_06185 [Colletotrichum karsti]KAF9876242.1 hypothetical protein CkaCkLH20_06185 [Colletotrichum karsti]
MMLDQLQTIQTEERVRSIKRRESLLHEAGTLNLPPSPVDDDASTPGTQSLSHDINFPPTPTDDDTPTPVDPPTSTADDEAHTTSATLNPYAACTPAELILGKAKVSNAILEFNDILEGLGGIVLRQQQLVTNSPLNAELLSLQERLSRVQSIAVTEHGLMAEESQARAQAADIQLQKREQGVIIKTSVGPDAFGPQIRMRE